MRKTILVLAANPKDTTPLRLDEELREIDNGLRAAKRRDEFVLRQVWAPRPVDVRRAILDCTPQIVHFSGHGSDPEGLVFEDAAGNSQFIGADSLAGFFELFSDSVECVVLNACYSTVQAEAIAKYIPWVIGMCKDIGDAAAIEFSVAFYDALGAGRSLDFAYRLACNAIQWTRPGEEQIPMLHRRPTTAAPAPFRSAEPLAAFQLTPRMPCLLLLDVSGSMAGEKIERLAASLREFVADLRGDEHTRERVEIALVTFGDSAIVLRDFAAVSCFDVPPLLAGGATPLGQALNLGLDLLGRRVATYHDKGVAFYKPLVLLLTDGSPTDSWDAAVNRLHTEAAMSRLWFMAVGIEGADMELLKRICPPGATPVELAGLRFSHMFRWFSGSIATVAKNPRSDIPAPTSWVVP